MAFPRRCVREATWRATIEARVGAPSAAKAQADAADLERREQADAREAEKRAVAVKERETALRRATLQAQIDSNKEALGLQRALR